MKLIKLKTDLIKAIELDKRLGFVPTMGSLHEGHKTLIKTSQKNCKKTLVSIFINPTQFNNKKDYKTYPKNLKQDLSYLKKLKVDYVYLPTIKQIYWKKNNEIKLNKSQKILCAKFRKGHFEGVLDVLDRFIELISPQKLLSFIDTQKPENSKNRALLKSKNIIWVLGSKQDLDKSSKDEWKQMLLKIGITKNRISIINLEN